MRPSKLCVMCVSSLSPKSILAAVITQRVGNARFAIHMRRSGKPSGLGSLTMKFGEPRYHVGLDVYIIKIMAV